MLTRTLFATIAAVGLSGLAAADLPLGGPPGAPTPAPAQGGPQKQLDDAIKSYFAGEWRLQSTIQGVLVDVQVSYRPDGSMSGTQTLTQSAYTNTYPVSGSYMVQAISDKRFLLSQYPQGSSQTTSELTIIDQNTLFNQQANYYAYRVTGQ